MRDDIAKDGINTRFSKENQPDKNGRPKGSRSVGSVLKELLAGMDPQDKRWQSPLAKKLIQIIFGKDENGKPLYNEKSQLTALREMLDRIEGKSVQKQEVDATVNIPKANFVVNGEIKEEKNE